MHAVCHFLNCGYRSDKDIFHCEKLQFWGASWGKNVNFCITLYLYLGYFEVSILLRQFISYYLNKFKIGWWTDPTPLNNLLLVESLDFDNFSPLYFAAFHTQNREKIQRPG